MADLLAAPLPMSDEFRAVRDAYSRWRKTAIERAIDPLLRPSKKSTNKRAKRMRNPSLETVFDRVRAHYRKGISMQELCRLLADEPRPPNTAWSRLTWPNALRHSKYRASVFKWFSKHREQFAYR